MSQIFKEKGLEPVDLELTYSFRWASAMPQGDISSDEEVEYEGCEARGVALEIAQSVDDPKSTSPIQFFCTTILAV